MEGGIIALVGSDAIESVPVASVVPQHRVKAQQRLRDQHMAVARMSMEAFEPHASTRVMHELSLEACAMAEDVGIDGNWLAFFIHESYLNRRSETPPSASSPCGSSP